MRIHGFEPLAQRHAHTLILGSMPSRESLRQTRYYAHPRNCFWPLLAELLRLPPQDYSKRALRVKQMGFAIWDVLHSCSRASSLDSDIVESSIQPNDFESFFAGHPRITRIFFNGAKAEVLYRRHVLSRLPPSTRDLSCQRLPSTSPANAAMTLEQKRQAWRVILPLPDAIGSDDALGAGWKDNESVEGLFPGQAQRPDLCTRSTPPGPSDLRRWRGSEGK